MPFSGNEEWFAVQTRPRYEKRVVAELQQKAIEVFLPLLPTKRQWSDRQRVVDLPLFPTYIFARITRTADKRVAVLRTDGVAKFVGNRGAGTPIPESEIESVRILLKGGVPFQSYPFLSVGQRVRVRGSSLDGVEGVLLAKNDDLSLMVSVEIIQRSLSVRIAGYQVEKA